MTDAQRRVCAFVRAHPRLLAALYDLDLMPLDLPPELVDARVWSRIVRVVALYAEAAGIEPPWLVAEANATREGFVRALKTSPESPAARARRRARETGEAPPSCAWSEEDPPCSCLDDAPLMTMRDAPGNDAAAEAFVRATTPTSADPLIRDHAADAFIGAGAVFVMPEPSPQVEPRTLDPRTLAACAACAEWIEREALGSPIAQDTARRIRLAILALR